MNDPFDEAFGNTNPAQRMLERARTALESNLAASAAGRAPRMGETLIKEFGESARKKPADYNDRAKTWMRRQGWDFERADYFDHRMTRHHDLLGMFDYLAFGDGETIGVQITSRGSVSARKKKILDEPRLAYCRRAGWKVLVLGFEGGNNEVLAIWI